MSTSNSHPTVLHGDQLISTVETYNQHQQWGLAYHGSHRPYATLSTAPAFWRKNGVRYDDGGYVVCADTTPLVPAFMALVPRRYSYGYRPNEDGGVDFYIDYEGRPSFESFVGYIAVLAAADFAVVTLPVPEGWPSDVPYERPPELRRTAAIGPEYYIGIGYGDFLALLDESPTSNFEYRDA